MKGILIFLFGLASPFFSSHKIVEQQSTMITTPSLSAQASSSPSSPSSGLLTKKNIDAGVFGLSITYRGQSGLPELMSDLGTKWVRMEFHWGFIDQLDGTYRWQEYDALVSDLQKRGINVLATIDYIPPTLMRAADDDWNPVYEKYSAFIRALTKRYKPGGILAKQERWDDYGISYWEVFNEPNLPGYGWLTRESNPIQYLDQYAQFLRLSNTVMHAQDSQAVIVLGGLSRMTPGGMPPEEFMREMYARNTKNCFDIVGFHPYGLIDQLNTLSADISNMLAPYGDVSKPIWFNEFGTADEGQREAYLNKVFQLKNSLNGLFWFTLIDPAPTGDQYGLVRYDGTKNPSYFIFRDFMQQSQ